MLLCRALPVPPKVHATAPQQLCTVPACQRRGHHAVPACAAMLLNNAAAVQCCAVGGPAACSHTARLRCCCALPSASCACSCSRTQTSQPFSSHIVLANNASQWQTNNRRRCSFRPDPQLAVVQWAAGHGTCAPASSLFASTTLAGDVIVSSSLSRYGCDGCMPSST